MSMKLIRKAGRIVAAGALALGVASASVAEEPMKFVAITHITAADPFGNVLKRGFDDAAATMGVEVRYMAPEQYDVVEMAQLIDLVLASKPDGLVVTIPDPDALGDGIRSAVDAGIPVVSTNAGADVRAELGVLAHVGQDEYKAGLAAGKRMKDAGVTKAVCVNMGVGEYQLDQRCNGFKDGLEGEVEVLAVSKDPTEIRNAVIAYLSKKPDTNGVLTLGPVASVPTLAALEREGLLDKVHFGTFDLVPQVLEAIRDGKMAFAIDQQQYLQGYFPVVMLTLFNKYGVVPAGDVLTGPGFVTQENAAQVIELSAKGYR